MTERTCVGAIAGAFGVRGELRIKSFCADPSAIGTYSPLTSEDGKITFELKVSRPIKAGFAGRIKGVDSKEDADALKGTRLYVARDQLPELGDDEYYHSDLIGLDVLDTGGAKIGTIKSIMDNGATDLLELHGPKLGNGIFLPFTKACVPTIDITTGRVIIDPPEGLLPEGKRK